MVRHLLLNNDIDMVTIALRIMALKFHIPGFSQGKRAISMEIVNSPLVGHGLVKRERGEGGDEGWNGEKNGCREVGEGARCGAE